MGARRPSLLSQTSYFNQVILEKPEDEKTAEERRKHEKVQQ